MNNEEFTQFLTNLGAFESGIDTTVPQTEYWLNYLQVFDPSKGNVDRSTVDINNPNDLAELQYHVHNTIGFLGKYQFGEALLIDLGYYTPAASGYYPNTASNEWLGTWTGKNGVNSKEDFMSNIQETAIREAFSMNMGVINKYLSQASKTIDDFLGSQFDYVRGGEAHVATVTMSGILASAHLQGPGGVALLLLNNIASSDEYGTNILFYMDKFGGFDTPFGTDANDDLVGSDYTETFIGEDGINNYETGDGYDKIIIANNSSNQDIIRDFDVTKDVISLTNFAGLTASSLDIKNINNDAVIEFPNGQTVVLQGVNANDISDAQFVYGPYKLTWDANSGDTVLTNFNLKHDLIDLNYAFGSNNLAIYEENGSTVIEVIGNNQRMILEGVLLEDLSSFHFLKSPPDFAEVHFGVNADNTPPDDSTTGDTGNTGDNNPGDTGGDVVETEPGSLGGDVYSYTWNWGANEVINQFDPTADQLDLHNFWTNFSEMEIYNNTEGNAVIDLTNLNNQTITLLGVDANDLQDVNFIGVAGSLAVGDTSNDDPVDDTVDDTTDDTAADDVVDDGNNDNGTNDQTPPNDDTSTGNSGDGNIYSFTWQWGSNNVINDFSITEDAIDLQSFWTSYDAFGIYNVDGNAVIDLTSLNNQTITIVGTSAEELSENNIIGVNGSLSDALTGQSTDTGNNSNNNDNTDSTDNTNSQTVNHGVDDALIGTDNAEDVFNFTWNWGRDNVINGFNPTEDVVDLTKFWTTSDQVQIYNNNDGNAVIDLSNINNQTITITGISADDLNDDNVLF